MKLLSHQDILDYAAQTIALEAASVTNLAGLLTTDFAHVVTHIHKSTGRVVISGIGKSAIIAQKIVATMNSTGTPALFLHAADAIHGDLGMLQPNDTAILISKSGESNEIKALLPLIKNFGNTVIAICGNTSSFLAKNADFLIDATVSAEACPNNLAPTSSTTAQLVLGDALAVCLLALKGFTPDDFARFHPGGALGKQLYLQVLDLAAQHTMPQVVETDSLPHVLVEMSAKRLGATAVVNSAGQLVGIITDGDIRRAVEAGKNMTALIARDVMNTSPKTISQTELAVNALRLMRQHMVMQLICVDEQGNYSGMIHMHDLMREGII